MKINRRIIIGLILPLVGTGGIQALSSQQPLPIAVSEQSESSTHTQADASAHSTGINDKDAQGKTPLMLAAERGDAETLKELLSKNADVSILDDAGKSAMDYARSNGATDCIDILFDAIYPANAAHSSDSKHDIELIEDATRFKLAGLALAPQTPGIGTLEFQPDGSGSVTGGSVTVRPPPWAGKFDDILSEARTAFLTKYELDPKIYHVSSTGSLNHIGTRSDGNDILVYMDMEEWTDIISVTPSSTKFLPVKLKSGLMTMRLPLMEVSFVESAECSVNGSRYVYRDGHWSPK